MGKGSKTDKEIDMLDRLKYENKHLKKQLKAARKLLDRYAVAEKIGLLDSEKILPSKKRKEEKEAYEKWTCYSCGAGKMELVFFGNRYMRKCSMCDRKTKSKVIHDDLAGILPDGKVYKEEK